MLAHERSEEAARQREKTVRAQHVAATNARRRTGAALAVAVLALAGGNGYLVWRNGALAKQMEGQRVVYTVLQPNGAWVASESYTEVAPPANQAQDVPTALWAYIQARDCYGASSPMRQYYLALSMSDVNVGRQVREQFLLTNPLAPQHVYGEHNLTVQCDLVDPPSVIGDPANNQYYFRFRRWEQAVNATPADMPLAPVYALTVRFRTGVYPNDPNDRRRAWLDRTEFNPAGVQVVDYPGAKPENPVRAKGR